MKRYDQYCPIACTLDVIGERWSLLIVRELFYGPKRYTDLAERLPGIGTNILAARLKDLEAAGLVERRKLPPPAASTVYELTAAGLRLRPVLHELLRFGVRLMGPPPAGVPVEEGWLLGAIDLAFASLRPEGTIAFRIDAEEASLVAGSAVPGVAPDADALVEGDAAGFYHLFVDGALDGVRIEGDTGVVERLIERFAATPEPLPA